MKPKYGVTDLFERVVSAILSVILFVPNMLFGGLTDNSDLRIVVPQDGELCVGDSRILECVFDEDITNRKLEWRTEPQGVASVDKWGRVTALSVGKATVTASGDGFEDSVELNVVASPTPITEQKRTVMYGGDTLEQVPNLQKFVTRYPNGDPAVPASTDPVPDRPGYQS